MSFCTQWAVENFACRTCKAPVGTWCSGPEHFREGTRLDGKDINRMFNDIQELKNAVAKLIAKSK